MEQSRALAISADGIEAQRRVLELIASNIANMNTTRTIQGGPYRRKVAIVTEKPLIFSEILGSEENKLMEIGGGVRVADVIDDPTPLPKVYKPGHPDADVQGFVFLPNVSQAQEMTDLVSATKLSEANMTVFKATKQMLQSSMQLVQ